MRRKTFPFTAISSPQTTSSFLKTCGSFHRTPVANYGFRLRPVEAWPKNLETVRALLIKSGSLGYANARNQLTVDLHLMNSKEEIESSLILSDLLERINQGDSTAETLLYDQYSRRLIALAATKISSVFRAKVEPEDIVQSVLCSFFVRQREGQLKFESWKDLWNFLVTVTVRKCGQQVRKQLSEKRNINRELDLNSVNDSDRRRHQTESPEPTPLQISIFCEMLELLVENLNESQVEIIRLRLEGETFEEISRKIERSERSVYRAMQSIQAKAKTIIADDKVSPDS